MIKFIIFSISFLFFLLVVLPLVSILTIKVIPGGIQPSLGNTVKIYDQSVYSQSFVSSDDFLIGIGTSIKNPNFANKKKAFFNLYDEQNKLIRTVLLNGSNIADGKFVKILFDPIEDAKDKKFSWSIHSFDSTFDDALELFLTDQQPSWSLEFKINEKVEKEGVSYITLHKPKSKTAVLEMVIGEWVNKIKGESTFSIIYTLVILVLLGLIIFPNLNRRIGKD